MQKLVQQLPKDSKDDRNFFLRQLFMSKLPQDMAKLLDGVQFNASDGLQGAQAFLNKADSLHTKSKQKPKSYPINSVDGATGSARQEPDPEVDFEGYVMATYTDAEKATYFKKKLDQARGRGSGGNNGRGSTRNRGGGRGGNGVIK